MRYKVFKRIALIISVLALCCCSVEMSQQSDPQQVEQTQEEEQQKEPTPIVVEIKEAEPEGPVGTYQGTVTIVTPYQDRECWAGLIRIDMDGEKMRITVMDAVESTFADNF